MKLEGGDSSLIPHPSSLVIGVIPARYASTRFPGKLLADLRGKPVLQWTWESAKRAKNLDRLVIAAADERIAEAARKFTCGERRATNDDGERRATNDDGERRATNDDGERRLQSAISSDAHSPVHPEVIEVFDDCPSGSDRVWRAYEKLWNVECGMQNGKQSAIRNPQSEIIVNIQGDEPLLEPGTIDKVVERLLSDPEAGVATPVTPIRTEEEFNEPSVVKVVLDKTGRALYFSRVPIPHGWAQNSAIRNPQSAIAYRHIGLYAYRREVLKDFNGWPQCQLERVERLEQLRLLNNGVRVVTVVVESAGGGVDRKGDLEKMRGMSD